MALARRKRGGNVVGIDQRSFTDSDPFGSVDLAGDRESGRRTLNGSLEASPESQINIKGDAIDIDRFRRIAKRDGLRLIGLLRRALDAYEREASAGDIPFRSTK